MSIIEFGVTMAMVTLMYGVEQQEGWGRIPSASVLKNIGGFIEQKLTKFSPVSQRDDSDESSSEEQQPSLLNPIERWKR